MNVRTCSLLFAAGALSGLATAAAAAPLSIVNVGAPAVNCVFNPACKVTVTDTVGNFPPRPGYTGTPVLQSRTYIGAPGTPGAGLTAYVYRVDFTRAAPATDVNCATRMKIDFGPNTPLPYAGQPPAANVFVVTSGGLGSVGLASADKTGSIVTFKFAQPVCPGQTSYFFGLASRTPPKPNDIAKVMLTYGGGVVDVPVRRPVH